MKNLALVFAAILAPARLLAAPTEVVELLPMSNETYSTVNVATAPFITAVTVSSTSITRLDTAVTAACVTALGAAYKRAEVTVQNDGLANLFVAFSPTGWTAASGYKLAVGDVWTFKVGKGFALYGLSAPLFSGTARVGALCWK